MFEAAGSIIARGWKQPQMFVYHRVGEEGSRAISDVLDNKKGILGDGQKPKPKPKPNLKNNPLRVVETPSHSNPHLRAGPPRVTSIPRDRLHACVVQTDRYHAPSFCCYTNGHIFFVPALWSSFFLSTMDLGNYSLPLATRTLCNRAIAFYMWVYYNL